MAFVLEFVVDMGKTDEQTDNEVQSVTLYVACWSEDQLHNKHDYRQLEFDPLQIMMIVLPQLRQTTYKPFTHIPIYITHLCVVCMYACKTYTCAK